MSKQASYVSFFKLSQYKYLYYGHLQISVFSRWLLEIYKIITTLITEINYEVTKYQSLN